MLTLTLEHRSSDWWIIGLDLDCGPYGTKAEADEDRRRMIDFEKYEDKPGYVTGDTLRL